MLSSVLSAYARYRLRYPVYIFHHIPKCGGSSIRKALDEWFHVYDDYYDEDNEVQNQPVDLRYLNSEKCLCGHFGHNGYMIEQRYPRVFGSLRAQHRYRVFSFLREPLDMRCSLFRHEVQNNFISSQNLVESIMTSDNYYARIIGLTKENYKQKLDRYFFIGIQEEMQLCFDLLAEKIDKPKLSLPKENRSVQRPENTPDQLSAKEISKFRNINQLDYLIYDYVRDKIHR